MAEQRKFQAIKGVRDILPPESALWNRVEQTAREVFATYGYGEIRLPIFEQTELFARSVGQASDIVSKEMYSFEDRPAEVPDPHGKVSFPDYVRAVELAYEEGRIPRLPSNQEAIRRLKDHVSTMVSQFDPEMVKTWSQTKLREWATNIQYGFSLARTVILGEQISLRPEATASVCRAYIEHGMHTWPGNVKLYYIGPMFRRERPQKGRYRQFYQIGAEVLGQSDAPAIDAEVIEMLMAFFAKVGFSDTGVHGANVEAGFSPASGDAPAEKYSAGLKAAATGAVTLHINSIGCKECRPKYVARLREELLKHINELKADSQRRVETNPLRVLDSKLPEEQPIIEKLPRITEHLCAECREHYAEVKNQLALRGIAFQENWRLVRGLDYYMRTTFEITAPGLGAQNAVCGGGRYDGLVELLGGPLTKGIGFAIGTDRVILSLQSKGVSPSTGVDVLVAWKDDASLPSAQRVARILRDSGLRVEMPSKAMQPREGIGYANKQAIPVAVIIGPDEVSAGVFAVRLLGDREQIQVNDNQTTQVGRLLLFRILLEKTLQQIAKKRGFDKQVIPSRQLLSELVNKGVVPGHLRMLIEMAFDVFNRAAHGEDLRRDEQSRAVASAVTVLEELTRDLGIEADLRGH